MYYVLFILVCLVLAALVAIFIKYVSTFIVIGLCLTVIGVLIIPLNMDLGIKISIYSLFLSVFILIMAGISGIVSAIVLTPIITIWYSIKNLFNKD